MLFRESQLADIPQMMALRLSVKENPLSNPALVPESDYIDFTTRRGKGWVCEAEGQILGFAVADMEKNNIWALFILPGFEGKGIGRRLHDDMLNWYFSQTNEPLWLSTATGTRAEAFYRKAGWREAGMYSAIEVRFEMTKEEWRAAE